MGLIDISLWDNYKHAIEALSGGKNTVVFDNRGLPSVMVRIPRLEFGDVSLDTAPGNPPGEYGAGMPAFRCDPSFGENGLVSCIYIGKYQAYEYDGLGYSLPYKDPKVNVDFDTSRESCTKKGTGWHLMTNAEWAAIAHWSKKNGTMPRGNNNFLKDFDEPHECGIPTQTGIKKGRAGAARIYTGSGPDTWNHDHGPYGIADMNGNIWERVDGLKIESGIAKIMPDKTCKSPGNNFVVQETSWINTNTKITAGYSNGDRILTLRTGSYWTGLAIPKNGSGAGCEEYGYDAFWLRDVGERVAVRGGRWHSKSSAGIFSLALDTARSYPVITIGYRLAYVV